VSSRVASLLLLENSSFLRQFVASVNLLRRDCLVLFCNSTKLGTTQKKKKKNNNNNNNFLLLLLLLLLTRRDFQGKSSSLFFFFWFL